MKNKEVVNFDEFNRIFCKGIFKDALISITNSFEKLKNDEVPLAIKVNEYQRNQLFSGLE